MASWPLSCFPLSPLLSVLFTLFIVKGGDLGGNILFFFLRKIQLKKLSFIGCNVHYLTLTYLCFCMCHGHTSGWWRWLAGVRKCAVDTPLSSQFWFSVAVLLSCAMWHLRAAGCLSSICINGEMDPCPCVCVCVCVSNTHTCTDAHIYTLPTTLQRYYHCYLVATGFSFG